MGITLTFEKFKAIDINTRINFFKYRNDRNDPEYEKEFLFVFQEIENYLKKLYSNGEISDTDMTLLFGKKKGELK
jgi:hypothetical protein